MTLMPKPSSSMEATMSKIGRVNLELQEQANELGFSTVQEALDNGYEVDYFWNSPDAEDFGTHPELVYLGKEPTKCEHELVQIDDGGFLEEAHKAWLKEKEEVLKELESLLTFNKDDAHTPYEVSYMLEKSLDKVKHAIDFIEKGEV